MNPYFAWCLSSNTLCASSPDIHYVYSGIQDVHPDIHYCILTRMMSMLTCMVRIYSRNKMHYKLHVLHAVKDDSHDALIKNKIKFSSSIRKFGGEQLQSLI